MPPNDHDLLIALNTKVDSLSDLNAKVDSLLGLSSKVDSILARLNGHVPEKCIRNDDRLTRIERDFASYVESHIQFHKEASYEKTHNSRWTVGTVLAICSLLLSTTVAVVGWISIYRHP